MTILITGGNGNVGHHLVDALRERGDPVRVLALPSEDTSWLEDRGVEVYRGDICARETLVEPMRGVEAVVHLAAIMGVWRPMEDYHAVNVTGTENVCRVALAQGVRRLVHVSSWTVYGMGRGGLVSEETPLKPMREPYVLTKVEGDKLVRRMIAEQHLPAVIVRPGTIFGPGDKLNFGRMADGLRTGRWAVVGSGNNLLPFVYVTDVIQGLLLALDRDNAIGQAYNITNDHQLSQRQLLEAIAQEIGASPPRRSVPYHPLYAAACAAELVAKVVPSIRQPAVTRHGVKLFGTDNRHSIDKARRELGFSPQVGLREGVRLAASWYRDEESGRTSPDRDSARVAR